MILSFNYKHARNKKIDLILQRKIKTDIAKKIQIFYKIIINDKMKYLKVKFFNEWHE